MLKSSLEKEEKALYEICGENVTLPTKPGIATVCLNEYHKDGTKNTSFLSKAHHRSLQ
jgi:hypothetical protein